MNLSDEFTRDMYLTSYHLIVARDRFDVFEMETFGQVGTFKPFGFDEPECRFAKLTNFCTSVDGRIWASSACNPSTSRHCMFELGMIVDGVPHAFITKMPSPIGYWLVYKDEEINAGNSTYSFKVEFIVLDKASHSGL
ncbi:hypothetical protein HDU82_003708 [Entophlyctis luteolus]|nr:hypothetical protein HDU82_003708 [Entophlyctis luteolus]